MKFPALGVAIVNDMYRRNLQLANGDDPARRVLIRMIAEQMVFDTDDTNWGVKARNPTGDIGKDSISYRNSDGSMDIWDCFNGSTRQPQVRADSEADYKNVTDQAFIPVMPINHLNIDPPVPLPTPGNPPDDNDDDKLDLILDTLKTLINNYNNLAGEVRELKTDVANKHNELVQYLNTQILEIKVNQDRAYTGSLGLRVRLTPEGK